MMRQRQPGDPNVEFWLLPELLAMVAEHCDLPTLRSLRSINRFAHSGARVAWKLACRALRIRLDSPSLVERVMNVSYGSLITSVQDFEIILPKSTKDFSIDAVDDCLHGLVTKLATCKHVRLKQPGRSDLAFEICYQEGSRFAQCLRLNSHLDVFNYLSLETLMAVSPIDAFASSTSSSKSCNAESILRIYRQIIAGHPFLHANYRMHLRIADILESMADLEYLSLDRVEDVQDGVQHGMSWTPKHLTRLDEGKWRQLPRIPLLKDCTALKELIIVVELKEDGQEDIQNLSSILPHVMSVAHSLEYLSIEIECSRGSSADRFEYDWMLHGPTSWEAGIEGLASSLHDLRLNAR